MKKDIIFYYRKYFGIVNHAVTYLDKYCAGLDTAEFLFLPYAA